jgi:hypothetical protein
MINTNQQPTKYVKTGNHGKPILNSEYKAWKKGKSTTVDEHDANLICDSKEFMSDMVGTWESVSYNLVTVVGDPPMSVKNFHVTYKIEDDMLVSTSSTTVIVAGIEHIFLNTSCLEIENAHDKTYKSTTGKGEVLTGKWTTIGPKHHILVENGRMTYKIGEDKLAVAITSEIEGNNMTTAIIYPDKPGLGGTMKLLKTTEADGNNDLPVGTTTELEGNNITATMMYPDKPGGGGTVKVLKTTEEDTKQVVPGRIISTTNPVPDGKPKKKRWWKRGKQ